MRLLPAQPSMDAILSIIRVPTHNSGLNRMNRLRSVHYCIRCMDARVLYRIRSVSMRESVIFIHVRVRLRPHLVCSILTFARLLAHRTATLHKTPTFKRGYFEIDKKSRRMFVYRRKSDVTNRKKADLM